MPTNPLPDLDAIVRRRGGWFVTGDSWSGPWNSKEAAELAANGEYELAHIEHRKERPT